MPNRAARPTAARAPAPPHSTRATRASCSCCCFPPTIVPTQFVRFCSLSCCVALRPVASRAHPVVKHGEMKSRVQLDIIRYIYTFQSIFEPSSSQTECFSLPIHSESCNMRLCYCLTADYCRNPSPDCRRTAAGVGYSVQTCTKRPGNGPRVRQLLDLTRNLSVPRPGRATLMLIDVRFVVSRCF